MNCYNSSRKISVATILKIIFNQRQVIVDSKNTPNFFEGVEQASLDDVLKSFGEFCNQELLKIQNVSQRKASKQKFKSQWTSFRNLIIGINRNAARTGTPEKCLDRKAYYDEIKTNLAIAFGVINSFSESENMFHIVCIIIILFYSIKIKEIYMYKK